MIPAAGNTSEPSRPLLRVAVVANHIRESSSSPSPKRVVSIGDVVYNGRAALQPALVPHAYAKAFKSSQLALEVWQWMLRKNAIGQDCFLIGPPGALRRRLSLAWCEILNREVEYLALSRDTTEADLKQRREIMGGTLMWVDQPPVRAARHGRVLVLDGLEKAERNVLPTLNNLLENREMSLQDGTFLTSPERFDALHDAMAAQDANLVRVHEDFRVIALGLPVPLFPGFPLDPPLRSRFQARHVGAAAIGTQLASLKTRFAGMADSLLEALAAFSDAMSRVWHEGNAVPGPKPWPVSEETLAAVCSWLEKFPQERPGKVLHRMYPWTLLPHDASRACKEALYGVGIDDGQAGTTNYTLQSVSSDVHAGQLTVGFAPSPPEVAQRVVSVSMDAGTSTPSLLPPVPLVETPTHEALLCEALQCAAAGKDVCFVGTSGSGKTALARRLARALGCPASTVHTFHLYKDMTSRDFLLRRSTDDRGDTYWEPSPLLTAALSGGICIVDGIQRLRADTLAALQALCADRDLELADGTRLCHHTRYAAICAAMGVTGMLPQEGLDIGDGRRLRPIHHSFRLIALALPPGQKPIDQWLTAEVLPLFAWLVVPQLQSEELAAVLSSRAPSSQLPTLLRLAEQLRDSSDKSPSAEKSWSLSLRQLLRLARRAQKQQSSSLAADVKRVALSSFMPVLTRKAFEAIVHEELGSTSSDCHEQVGIKVTVKDGVLDIGGSRLPIAVGTDPRLVPKTRFYDIPRHLLRLREIILDLSLGERHLLLIGNQGTGKNKLVDNLLQLLQWEREYIQLHRDTTVSSLTVQATLLDGKVVWEDSALVKAVKYGRTLVVDEADKAPLEVVCILKGLVEDGEMTLSDGRRILREPSSDIFPQSTDTAGERIIQVHPNFKMFLLANRPGFPFQGNDLFRETGDVYAPHLIENPDLDSEVSLLSSYAPDVEPSALRRLSSAFSELRGQVDEGLLSYPYSTRELVNVAKHLQKFPGEGVGRALRDILDFDRHDRQTLNTLREVLLRWGIPLDASPDVGMSTGMNLALERRLPEPVVAERWLLRRGHRIPVVSLFEVEARNCSYMLTLTRNALVTEAPGSRSSHFSEEVRRWRLPLGKHRYETETCHQAVVLPNEKLCALIERNPTGAFSLILQNMQGDATPKFCDRLDAPFGVRSPMRRDSEVKLFSIGPDIFGLAGEKRLYILDLSQEAEPKGTELTLPMDMLAKLSGVPGSVQKATSPFIDQLPAAPRWNVDFADAGIVAIWVPGNETVAILNLKETQGRCFSVPGLNIAEVWMVTADELLLSSPSGEVVHLDVSIKGRDVLLSEVAKVRAPGGDTLSGLRNIEGAKEAALPRDACATVAAESVLLGTLVREARGAFVLKSDVEHFGKDAFVAMVWPRPTALAQPLRMIAPASTGMPLVSAAIPEGNPPEAWTLEIMDLAKGTIRTVHADRLGASSAPADAEDDEAMRVEAPLAALAMSGSKAIIVQVNGWIRVVEVGLAALEDQRKQWQSMLGTASSDLALDLKISGEEGEEDNPSAEGADTEGDVGEAKAVERAVQELDVAFRGVQQALQKQDYSEAALQEIRAHLAATTISASAPRLVADSLQRAPQVAPEVRAALETVLQDRQAENMAKPEGQGARQQSSSQAPSGGGVQESAVGAAITRALAKALARQRIEQRIEESARAAMTGTNEAIMDATSSRDAQGQGSALAKHQAQLELARALAEAAEEAQHGSGNGASDAGSNANLEQSLDTAMQALESMASATRERESGNAPGISQTGSEPSREHLKSSAAALVKASQGLARASGRGSGRGQGRGRGSGQGRSGQGNSGSGGSRGPASGKGTGAGSQLSSNQKGGYTDAQLHGQLSEEDMMAAARVLAKSRDLAKRESVNRNLRDFSSSEYDEAYQAVSRQIRELRIVLEQQEAKDKEREWVGHQVSGELDDNRLVDGVTGEKLIYRKRMEPDVPLGHQQKRPKRLSFVVDVSASMSRFNGEDGRLDRMVQAIVMIMESLEGFEHKYVWNLVGHSGNGHDMIFVDFQRPPHTRQQRAQVISHITSASALASSGDSTVEAIEASIQRVAAEEADDYLVFAVSDANLGGYGITPEVLRRVLTSDPKVSASAIFIAEREAAAMLSRALPPGRAFVCLDVAELPNVLKEIFARAATSN